VKPLKKMKSWEHERGGVKGKKKGKKIVSRKLDKEEKKPLYQSMVW